ncbi:hypothetical protein VC87395_000900A, partial [Vibrio paracholerae 87395]
MVTVRGMR